MHEIIARYVNVCSVLDCSSQARGMFLNLKRWKQHSISRQTHILCTGWIDFEVHSADGRCTYKNWIINAIFEDQRALSGFITSRAYYYGNEGLFLYAGVWQDRHWHQRAAGPRTHRLLGRCCSWSQCLIDINFYVSFTFSHSRSH